MACNECLFDFCEIAICNGIGAIDVQMTAPIGGIYSLYLRYQEGLLKPVDRVFGVGENVSFPNLKLNENYCYTGYIIKPTGERLVFMNDSKMYDGIKFCTRFKI
jgi:hypothetical protein